MCETSNVTHQRCRLAVDMPQNYRYPSILQSVWIVVLLNILRWVLFRLRNILWRVTGFLPLFHAAVSLLINVIAYGLILMGGLKRAHTSFREICPLARVRLSLLFPMALTVIGVLMLLFEIDYWLAILLPWPEWYTRYRWLDAETSLWGAVSGVIVAPLTEELLVRGLILRGFLNRYSVRKAILASALLFGLMHRYPWQFIAPTVGGILFAWWLIETRSMLPCFLGHALINALIMANNALLQSGIEFEVESLWWNLVGVILTALGVWLLVHQFRKSRDTVPEDVSRDKPDEL